MEITHFSEIEDEFIRRVHTMIWCNVATVDRLQRPRSRILHLIWEGETGWIATHSNSFNNIRRIPMAEEYKAGVFALVSMAVVSAAIAWLGRPA
jgi:hypothetical protein